ncbi:MAG: heavy metal translocating P-type ATPase [Leptospirales bacterium]|nr:heavy metal translocating P-type ATPase [Leptospirales bacterium]
MSAALSAAAPAVAKLQHCRHCGQSLPPGKAPAEALDPETQGPVSFCCTGCAGAFQWIHESGASAYYRFRSEYAPRPGEGLPDDLYTMLEKEAAADESGFRSGVYRLEGLHCASCVWLNEKLLSRLPGVDQVKVQLASGRVRLRWNPAASSLAQIAAEARRAGYVLSPASGAEGGREDQLSTDLLRRMALAGFFAGNIMLISVALYAGYFDFMDRYTRNFFHLTGFLLATPVVFYSARVFFRGAWSALKLRLLSMDILTSLGVLLAYSYSIFATLAERDQVYFDSICFVVFVVLIGRFIERRLRSRALYLLENLGSRAPRAARLVAADGIHWIPSSQIAPGQRLRLLPGEALAADGELLAERAECDVAALTGEFEPALYRRGQVIPGGAKALGAGFDILVRREASASYLSRLKELAESSIDSAPRGQLLAERIGRWFVAFVLVAATGTALYWAWWKGDVGAAVLNTVALLIVACPCALNLAIPSASIAAVQRAFRRGVALRDASALERLAAVRTMVFDKTGTLTAGRLKLAAVQILDASIDEVRALQLAADLESSAAVRHPLAEGFRRAAGASATSFDSATFSPGCGVEGKAGGAAYRLGALHWLQADMRGALAPPPMAAIGMSVYLWQLTEGQARPLAVFGFEDSLREGVPAMLAELSRHMKIFLLSGDHPQNVERLAMSLGIVDFAGGRLPEEKKAMLRDLKRRGPTAMVGDGANDSGALAQADVAISFAHGADLAIAQADLLLLNEDPAALSYAYLLARSMRRKVRQNLALAFLYNAALAPLAMIGLLNPLVGALFMAASSITVVLNSLALRLPRHITETEKELWNSANT